MNFLHRYLNTHQNNAEVFLLNAEMDSITAFDSAPGFSEDWESPIVLTPAEGRFGTFPHPGAWAYGGKFAVIDLGDGKFIIGDQIV